VITAEMASYVTDGWPKAVRPPGSDRFEASAVEFLLDVLPPEFRQYGVLRRFPVALASMARYYAGGCVEGARAGYRAARGELAEHVPPHAVDELQRAYRTEGFRLAATSRSVVLVEQALRGEAFRRPLLLSRPGPPEAGGVVYLGEPGFPCSAVLWRHFPVTCPGGFYRA
jgi:hypothetical protein